MEADDLWWAQTRELALKLAIKSNCGMRQPDDEIVARAEKYLAFLSAPITPKAESPAT
jgi:hypothetical protein